MDANGLWTFLAVITPAVLIMLIAGIALSVAIWWACK